VANYPPVAGIYGVGSTVNAGYPVYGIRDSNGALVTPFGAYVWNPNQGTFGLWTPWPVDTNGNPQVSLTGSNNQVVPLVGGQPISQSNPLPTTANIQIQSVTATDITIKGRSSHVALDGIPVTTTEANSPFAVSQIVFIANDGPSDMIINFDASTTSEGAFTLKSGEVLDNFPRQCTTLYYKAKTGNTTLRAVGVV
jgi:hypothetical protein